MESTHSFPIYFRLSHFGYVSRALELIPLTGKHTMTAQVKPIKWNKTRKKHQEKNSKKNVNSWMNVQIEWQKLWYILNSCLEKRMNSSIGTHLLLNISRRHTRLNSWIFLRVHARIYTPLRVINLFWWLDVKPFININFFPNSIWNAFLFITFSISEKDGENEVGCWYFKLNLASMDKIEKSIWKLY